MRFRWWWVIGLLLLGALGIAGQQGYAYWRVHRLRAAAAEAVAHFDFDKAREHLAVLLELRPSDAGLRLFAAQTARRAGFLNEAEEHLNAYHSLPGRSAADGALERALLTAQRGDFPQVIDFLQSRLDVHHPASNRILEALVQGAIVSYRLDQAKYWLDELLELEPANVTALLTVGQMYESVGKMDDAVEYYQKAVDSEPEHFQARFHVAGMLLGKNRAREAVEHYERLRQRHPGRAEVLLGLARCRLQLSERDAAIQLLDELLAGHPDDGLALFERGRLELESGRLDNAEEFLRHAVARMPHDRESNYQFSLCLQRLGKQEEAEKYILKMKEVETDVKRLEEVYQLAFKNKNDPRPRLEAARICMRNGQEHEGFRWLQSALQIDPQNRETHDALADYFERRGDAGSAKEHRQRGAGKR